MTVVDATLVIVVTCGTYVLSLQVNLTSPLAVVVAAQNGTINVHTNKAIPNSGAGYLALSLRQRSQPLYNHHVPGCSGGGSFLSVVSVFNDTCVTVDKFSTTPGEAPQRLQFVSMQVGTNSADLLQYTYLL